MKTMIVRGLCLGALALWLASPAWAQSRSEDVDVTSLPGYFDFGDLHQYSDGDEVVEVDVAQPLLTLVGKMLMGEDPGLGELLASLDLVRVHVFSYDGRDEDTLRDKIDAMSAELDRKEWDNIVRVRGSEEHANIFVKMATGESADASDPTLTGLAILVLDDEEAVFVNVVGEFGMDEISRIGDYYDIPHMRDFERRSRRGEG
jgi:hypothetical protein